MQQIFEKALFFRVVFSAEEVGKVTVSFSFPSGSLDLMKNSPKNGYIQKFIWIFLGNPQAC